MLKLRNLLISVMLPFSFLMNAQDLRVTFTASGASSIVDSVKATNLRTNHSVSLPGNDTLYLELNTGISELSGSGKNGIVFPNPCSGTATLIFPSIETGTSILCLMNLSGQVLVRISAEILKGYNIFQVSLSKAGVYLISFETGSGISGFKIICTETLEGANRISYKGTMQGNKGSIKLKDQNIYRLGYASGDIILYRCRGGVHTTIITDSPDVSKNYTVEFVPCIDPAGKSYAIVKIGNQTWMAENMAWLPKVMKPDTGAENLKFYYVYDYNRNTITEAKASPKYTEYGAMYNWEASSISCPAGWHLPVDEEWKTMEEYLGMLDVPIKIITAAG